MVTLSLMMGGINNGMFLHGLGGFFALVIIIPIMIWMSASPTKRKMRRDRRALKRSLRRVQRK